MGSYLSAAFARKDIIVVHRTIQILIHHGSHDGLLFFSTMRLPVLLSIDQDKGNVS
jgi:hypothetical protein